MTVAEAFTHYTKRLETAIDAAEAHAMMPLLLEYVCKIDRSDFQKLRGTTLHTAQTEQLTQLTQQILAGKPLQYVLGEAWFCGLKLMVNAQVLIPRPETEELVEWIIANCRFPVSALQIMDMCTGSGCIALALKRRIRKATVTAVDVDPGALSVARYNAQQLGISIDVLQADLSDSMGWTPLGATDIIVSNPPYISAAEKAEMSPTVLDHEPHLALFAPEADPLFFYKQLALLAEQKLNPQGQLFTELNASYAQEVGSLFLKAGFQIAIKADMQGKERMLRAWR
ncbi:MAG: peptide chain release factor N(5)-glutamine methyltransferase [Sphingomonadales bacterium]|nr:peptide chain release factor N(5)-glutamine methyltransferase [Sphingomonadales bacterium]